MFEKEISKLSEKRISHLIKGNPQVDTFFDRRRYIVKNLFCGGRKNPLAIAILFAEDYFRPFHFRILEYLALLAMKPFSLGNNLTVGISQFRYEKWKSTSRLKINDFESYETNYDLIVKEVKHFDHNDPIEISKAIASHVGETRFFYFCLVRNYLFRIKFLLNESYADSKFSLNWTDY